MITVLQSGVGERRHFVETGRQSPDMRSEHDILRCPGEADVDLHNLLKPN